MGLFKHKDKTKPDPLNSQAQSQASNNNTTNPVPSAPFSDGLATPRPQHMSNSQNNSYNDSTYYSSSNVSTADSKASQLHAPRPQQPPGTTVTTTTTTTTSKWPVTLMIDHTIKWLLIMQHSNDYCLLRWDNANLFSPIRPIHRPSSRSVRDENRSKPPCERWHKTRPLTTNSRKHETSFKLKQSYQSRQHTEQNAYCPDTGQAESYHPANCSNSRHIKSEFVLSSSSAQAYTETT